MGMFDSIYDQHGNEWQTKAFDRNLDCYQIGDIITADTILTCQVEVLGENPCREFIDGYANIRAGVIESITLDRDPTLPLLDYGGHYHPPTLTAALDQGNRDQ